MSELPVGWVKLPLGSLIEGIDAGKNIRCIERPPDGDEPGIVKISAVSWGAFREEESKTIPPGVPVDERARIRSGDLLISRANTVELVGATVRVGALSKRLYLSDKVLRIRADSELLPWIHRVLTSPEMRQEIAQRSSGNQLSMRNISQEALRNLEIPIAPPAERSRILHKLETLLQLTSGCRSRLRHVPGTLNRFREAVLEAAVSGRLTEEWRSEAGVSSQSWTRTPVGSILTGIEAGLNIQCEERPPEPNEKGLVKISAVTWGRFDADQSKTLPRTYAVPEPTRIRAGDFLLSRANTLELVGACVIVEEVKRPLYLSDKVLRLELEKSLKPWLLIFLRSPRGRQQIESRATGNQLSMRNLSQSNLKEIEVPMPGSDERAEICRRVNDLLRKADQVDQRCNRVHGAIMGLAPAILAKAFRGELVPQDPRDESARAILLGIPKDVSCPREPQSDGHRAVADARVIEARGRRVSGRAVRARRKTA